MSSQTEVKATEKGIDGFNIFKPAGAQTSSGVNPEAAIDGKKSTYFEGKDLQLNLGGVGSVKTVGLKLAGSGKPSRFRMQKGAETITASLVKNGPVGNGFTYYVFSQAAQTSYVKVETEDDAMTIITMQLYEIEIKNDVQSPSLPDQENPPIVPGELPPPQAGWSKTAEGFPVPPGFTPKGNVSTAFVHWGRHETNYSSGGSGPSERWDNSEVQALNVIAGYEVNLGEAHGSRGEDNFDLKFRGDSHSDSNGGWYIPSIEWGGKGQIGKEYPHPTTSHLPIQEKGSEVGNMKGDFWVAFLAACFNDAQGVPTIMLWARPKDKTEYVYMGKSRDTGNMKPGPVLVKVGMKGSTKQTLQIRMDEVPDAKIRNPFAVEIEPPK